jgi:2-hydroxy-3-oxopropionate reductase
MIERIVNPGFRIKLHQKDLCLALAGTVNAAQPMQACAANRMHEPDHSALVRALQLMAAHEVAAA